MVRRRGLRDRPTAQREEEEETQAETDDEEEAEADPQPETSIEDLTREADPNDFDRSFLLESDQLPFGAGEAPPVPQPFEGIPRLAFVVNLNYVYDEEQDAWIKKRTGDGAQETDTIDPVLGTGDIGDPGVVAVPDPSLSVSFTLDQTSRIEFPDPTVSTTIV